MDTKTRPIYMLSTRDSIYIYAAYIRLASDLGTHAD